MKKTLSKHQEKVVKAFRTKNKDVSIKKVYDKVYTYPPSEWLTVREMQQKLGAAIVRVNAKIKPHRIGPGETKQTYRYYTRQG